MDQTASSTPYHRPVLVDEVRDLFAPVADGLIVDGTLGGAGHTGELLAAFPGIRILGMDRDPDAVAEAPADERLTAVVANFADMSDLVAEATASGVLLDLGVSSHQLDTPQRGFSFRASGPVDMRMGPDSAVSAGQIVNEWPRAELAAVIARFGEERHAGRIADAIVANRPIEDTAQLAAVVAEAVPAAARRARHPARKTFQALRIAVNDELDSLRRGLDGAIAALRPGGRLVVIAYHSLEDRIVKRRIAAGTTGCICPPDLPVCGCGRSAELRSLTRKPIVPSLAEAEANPRSRSALLRAAEKVAP